MVFRTVSIFVLIWAFAEGFIANRQAQLVLDKMTEISTSHANEWFALPQFTYHDSYGYEVTYTPRFRSLAGFDMYDNATTSIVSQKLYIHIPLNVRDLVTEYQVTCEGREYETFVQNVTTSNLDQATIKISVTSSADFCTGTLADVDVGPVHSPTTYGRPAPSTFCYSAVGDHLINALTRHFFGHVRESAKKLLSKSADLALKRLNLC
uniref:NADH-ubiquinone oxidoreductase chain 1 n=1 Tax=Lygus hesperus TaxID=30085 RepID=A0A0A9WK75_LYGHE